MNIDILNAYCGLGHSRGHACLRVGRLTHRGRPSRSRLERRSVSLCGFLAPSLQIETLLRLGPFRLDPVALVKTSAANGGGGLLNSKVVHPNCSPQVSNLCRPGTNQRQCSRQGLGTKIVFRPEIRRDYPLNLSISLSGGKETNQDSPSNGE